MEAYLTTPMLDCGGKSIILNALTLDGGEVTVDLLDETKKPIHGFAREDSIPFRGDDKLAAFGWKGSDRISVEKAHVRFYIKRARLYGYQLPASLT